MKKVFRKGKFKLEELDMSEVGPACPYCDSALLFTGEAIDTSGTHRGILVCVNCHKSYGTYEDET